MYNNKNAFEDSVLFALEAERNYLPFAKKHCPPEKYRKMKAEYEERAAALGLSKDSNEVAALKKTLLEKEEELRGAVEEARKHDELQRQNAARIADLEAELAEARAGSTHTGHDQQALLLQRQVSILEKQKRQLSTELQYLKDVVASHAPVGTADGSECDDVYGVAKKIEDLHRRNLDLTRHLAAAEDRAASAAENTVNEHMMAHVKGQYLRQIHQLKAEVAILEGSDTTQVLRFTPSNPKDAAYERAVWQEAQASVAKRSRMNGSLSRAGGNTSMMEKGLREELQKAQAKVEQVAKQKEQALKEYRDLVAFLTGYNIVPQGDGLIEAVNTLDTSQVFRFRQPIEGTTRGIEVLCSEALSVYENLACRYLDNLKSIPGFLAAVMIENHVSPFMREHLTKGAFKCRAEESTQVIRQDFSIFKDN
ncbi:hypothetical protein AAVH_03110 [Aphelenchoides avenae]|nr:hypothetical protein AAVH_03110 [Aphelenchus avenae]